MTAFKQVYDKIEPFCLTYDVVINDSIYASFFWKIIDKSLSKSIISWLIKVF